MDIISLLTLLYRLNVIPIMFVAIIAIYVFVTVKKYKKTSYYHITKTPYFVLRTDKGKYGEYLIYKYLKELERNGAKFLFNVYIPKNDDETTEIDVLMICPKGIIAFESKNYSGWIFGNEYQRSWTQVLPTGRRRSHKEHFYNPIMQNRNHIAHLKALIGESVPIHSIIVFSERCTLKDVTVNSRDTRVINRNYVWQAVSSIINESINSPLTDTDVIDIYNKLYPYTQVDDEIRKKHILNIQSNLSGTKTKNTDTLEISHTADSPNSDSTNMPDSASALVCPRCGGQLVLRKAKRGENSNKEFYGCSNFPKCRYIQNINNTRGCLKNSYVRQNE